MLCSDSPPAKRDVASSFPAARLVAAGGKLSAGCAGLFKWQTDFGYYTGGNPSAGGQSPTGWIPGVDGYLLRTQFTFMF